MLPALILVLFSGLNVAVSVEYQWEVNQGDYISDGHQLVGHVSYTFYNAFQVTQCSVRCLTTPSCQSYNFLSDQSICQLNTETHITKSRNYKLVSGSEYYLRDAFTVQQVSHSL